MASTEMLKVDISVSAADMPTTGSAIITAINAVRPRLRRTLRAARRTIARIAVTTQATFTGRGDTA